jgi:hypothetical protein
MIDKCASSNVLLPYIQRQLRPKHAQVENKGWKIVCLVYVHSKLNSSLEYGGDVDENGKIECWIH